MLKISREYLKPCLFETTEKIWGERQIKARKEWKIDNIVEIINERI